jgi:hypothetical protein
VLARSFASWYDQVRLVSGPSSKGAACWIGFGWKYKA